MGGRNKLVELKQTNKQTNKQRSVKGTGARVCQPHPNPAVGPKPAQLPGTAFLSFSLTSCGIDKIQCRDCCLCIAT